MGNTSKSGTDWKLYCTYILHIIEYNIYKYSLYFNYTYCILYSKSCIVYYVLSRLVAWQLATLTRLGALGQPWRPGVKQHHVGKNMGKTSNLIYDSYDTYVSYGMWIYMIYDIWDMNMDLSSNGEWPQFMAIWTWQNNDKPNRSTSQLAQNSSSQRIYARHEQLEVTLADSILANVSLMICLSSPTECLVSTKGLDLELVCVRQILGGHTKASRRHLSDRVQTWLTPELPAECLPDTCRESSI